MSSTTLSHKHMCGTCHQRFSTKAGKRQHRRAKHATPSSSNGTSSNIPSRELPSIFIAQSQKHVCNTCQRQFKTESAQRQHHRARHSTISSGNGTSSNVLSSNILSGNHSSSNPSLSTPSSSRELPSTSITQSKKHVCKTCQQQFSTKSAQKQHHQAKHSSLSSRNGTSSDAPSSNILSDNPSSSNAASSDPSPSTPASRELPSTLITQSQEHVCNTCQRRFSTKSAERKHHQAKHSMTSSSSIPSPFNTPLFFIDPSSGELYVTSWGHVVPPPARNLVHRGIAYSILSAEEQNIIQDQLSSFCHPEERLRKEGYKLASSTNRQDESSPDHMATAPHPSTTQSEQKAVAIVLDCEMAGTASRESELVQMTIIDFLSGTVLQSCLVNPSRPITNWREDVTGIDAARMQDAVNRHEALDGWRAARAKLWSFISSETIIIGQSVHHDLEVLHTSHARVIDTAIITADAVLGRKFKIRKRWGLQTLCQELLGIEIRRPLQDGDLGVHDALEDALATREVLLLCIQSPAKLKRWATSTRTSFFKSKKVKQKGRRVGGGLYGRIERRYSDLDAYEEEEGLRWEDVIDWEMWPKSPPDSD